MNIVVLRRWRTVSYRAGEQASRARRLEIRRLLSERCAGLTDEARLLKWQLQQSHGESSLVRHHRDTTRTRYLSTLVSNGTLRLEWLVRGTRHHDGTILARLRGRIGQSARESATPECSQCLRIKIDRLPLIFWTASYN